MGLLLLLKRRRRRNAGHAEFVCTDAVGSGTAAAPRRRQAVGLRVPPPQILPIVARGSAEFPVTQALGHGRTQDDALLIQLLLAAA